MREAARTLWISGFSTPDDGYLYITGLGTLWQNDELKHLVETAYPNEFTSVIADDGVPDSESFAARVDFPPSIYDSVRSDPLYSLGNDDTRLATVTEADPSSIPIAVDLGEYVVSEVYKTHHKWIGPNYAAKQKGTKDAYPSRCWVGIWGRRR